MIRFNRLAAFAVAGVLLASAGAAAVPSYLQPDRPAATPAAKSVTLARLYGEVGRHKAPQNLTLASLMPGAYCSFDGNWNQDGGRINCEYNCTWNQGGSFTTWFPFNRGTRCSDYN